MNICDVIYRLTWIESIKKYEVHQAIIKHIKQNVIIKLQNATNLSVYGLIIYSDFNPEF